MTWDYDGFMLRTIDEDGPIDYAIKTEEVTVSSDLRKSILDELNGRKEYYFLPTVVDGR